ncbi:MAG TPA: hypothetical protein PKW33_07910 [Anaerolineaceae bacterium]|nr:hypothetical protein [Anaerolineaceae bacterium]HPN51498.1 hypothetical protein [Anaerolineaceae bacterium]
MAENSRCAFVNLFNKCTFAIIREISGGAPAEICKKGFDGASCQNP